MLLRALATGFEVLLAVDRVAGEHLEGERTDESGRRGGDGATHVVAAFAQPADQVSRLVGGDPAANAEQDAAAAGGNGSADARRGHSVVSTVGASTGSGTGAGP